MRCGALNTRLAVKEVGLVVFHLESGYILEVVGVMHVLVMSFNFLLGHGVWCIVPR